MCDCLYVLLQSLILIDILNISASNNHWCPSTAHWEMGAGNNWSNRIILQICILTIAYLTKLNACT